MARTCILSPQCDCHWREETKEVPLCANRGQLQQCTPHSGSGPALKLLSTDCFRKGGNRVAGHACAAQLSAPCTHLLLFSQQCEPSTHLLLGRIQTVSMGTSSDSQLAKRTLLVQDDALTHTHTAESAPVPPPPPPLYKDTELA